MGAIIWADYLKQFKYFSSMSDSKSTLTVKLIVVLMGVVATGLAIIVSGIGGKHFLL
jgi:hypothetical protein